MQYLYCTDLSTKSLGIVKEWRYPCRMFFYFIARNRQEVTHKIRIPQKGFQCLSQGKRVDPTSGMDTLEKRMLLTGI
jgi:hypothetical protein